MAEPSAGRTKVVDRYRHVLAQYRDTSSRAHASITGYLSEIDSTIVREIERRGGATADEIERVTGLRHQTVSAQIRHLLQGGIVLASEARRPTRSGRGATVWILSNDAMPDGRLF